MQDKSESWPVRARDRRWGRGWKFPVQCRGPGEHWQVAPVAGAARHADWFRDTSAR